ncbi:MAG: hypothetical protein PHV34_23760 [Verrucomicrobiae bacterium]|nr:hypothetical protein [Verrucomicrobiae bacterium]
MVSSHQEREEGAFSLAATTANTDNFTVITMSQNENFNIRPIRGKVTTRDKVVKSVEKLLRQALARSCEENPMEALRLASQIRRNPGLLRQLAARKIDEAPAPEDNRESDGFKIKDPRTGRSNRLSK